ncbi:efflux RND transporter periplasmic adaptor subunit [Pigmentiphaga litoralis]|uniref:efflux RND transporter periplasmic adaptor subunit n=1 Tax=Pigmentiphaga litoralis TaxID=516702 RepID=UPI003B43572E
MQKSSVVLFVVLALVAGGAIGFVAPRYLGASAGPGTQAAAEAPKPPVARPVAVEVATVRRQPFVRGVSAVGSLRSDESVTLRPEVAGRISEIRFTEGQRVQRGQVLIKLDDSVPRAEFEQARANFSLAKSNFDRSMELQQKGFISKQARDEADNAMKVQQAAMVLAQVKLDKSEIRAPFHGVIGLRSVSVGDYVAVGQDMVPIEAIDALKVDFRMPERYLPQIRNGQALRIMVDAVPDKMFNGSVYAISPLIDAGGRSVVMRAQVRNTAAQLRPGMFARVELQMGGQSEALLVPEAALVPVGDNQFVFRVEEGRAVRVQIEVGERRDGLVEVIRGIEDQDIVVVAGTQKIRDGGAVTVAKPTGTGPATARTDAAPAERGRPAAPSAGPRPAGTRS